MSIPRATADVQYETIFLAEDGEFKREKEAREIYVGANHPVHPEDQRLPEQIVHDNQIEGWTKTYLPCRICYVLPGEITDSEVADLIKREVKPVANREVEPR